MHSPSQPQGYYGKRGGVGSVGGPSIPLTSTSSGRRTFLSRRIRILLPALCVSLFVVVMLMRPLEATLAARTSSKGVGVVSGGGGAILTENQAPPSVPSMPPSDSQTVQSSVTNVSPGISNGSSGRPPGESDPPRPSLDHQLSLVLTTRLGDAEGFPRLGNLLESIVKFLAGNNQCVYQLLVLVPDSDAELFRNAATALRRFARSKGLFDIRVLPDSQLLSSDQAVYAQYTPELEKQHGGRGTNYRIQMLLKLAVARFVRTEFYITLDSDVMLHRDTKFEDLVVDGKAIIQGETEQNTRHSKSWWASAETVLEAKECVARSNMPRVGVTPAILSSTISKGLYAEIERVHGASFPGDPWDVILFRLLVAGKGIDWTEYTLYWTYGCKQNLLSKFHTMSPVGLRLYDYGGFEYGSYMSSWRAKRVFEEDSKTVFTVLQSISGANPKWVNEQVLPYLA